MRAHIVVTLAPARGFYSAKCVQFPLTFTEKNQLVIFPLELLLVIFETSLIKK